MITNLKMNFKKKKSKLKVFCKEILNINTVFINTVFIWKNPGTWLTISFTAFQH